MQAGVMAVSLRTFASACGYHDDHGTGSLLPSIVVPRASNVPFSAVTGRHGLCVLVGMVAGMQPNPLKPRCRQVAVVQHKR